MMYFGTKDRMDWIPCPAVDRPASLQSPSGTLEYENGGAFVRRQYAGHRNYELTWNFLPNAEAEKIEAWAQGTWGKGPYYWIDPMIAKGNMLPMDWAFPGSVHLGAAPLVPMDVTNANPPSGYEGPLRGVQYSTTSAFISGSPRQVFLPIPPDHTLTFASRASQLGIGLSVRTYAVGSSNPGAVRQIASAPGYGYLEKFRGDVIRGVEISTMVIPGSTGTRSISIYGMSATLQTGLHSQPNPVTLADIPAWTPGIGHSGCEFTEHPERVDYSAALDKVGVTANLKEVGSWL